MIGLNRKITPTNGLKLLGERNSGTNVLETFLRRVEALTLHDNIPVLWRKNTPGYRNSWRPDLRYQAAHEAMLDHMHQVGLPSCGGWKHAAPNSQFQSEFLAPMAPAVLIIVRHPAPWLKSMHRNPFHTVMPVPRAFSDFLRQDWLTMQRDGLEPRLFPSVLAVMAAKFEAYAALLDRYENSSVIRYEDLVQDPEATLATIGLSLPANNTTPLPDKDVRPFAQKARKKWWQKPDSTLQESYRDIAARARFDMLSSEDREFTYKTLAESALLSLYSQ